jgi:hypothetical protein
MSFAQSILQYYKQLATPAKLPADIETMNPYQDEQAFELTRQFYEKYYSDSKKRIICFGINPGRFGGGITGIPFTDPINLEDSCGIKNQLQRKPELSSRFIYDMIFAFGGPDVFYQHVFISAVSPLGYIKDGINLNYYDVKGYKDIFEDYVVEEIRKQLELPVRTDIVFSIGKGKNIEFLKFINKKYGFFQDVRPLPHPRWVMQYRLKRKAEFIQQYVDELQPLF